MEDNLIAGLISGLVVTLLVVVFRNIWRTIITPWFEERVYKDIHIEGKWFSLYPTSVELRQEIIVLKRHGHAITGTLICSKGGDEGEEYDLCGSFRNLLLTLTYESTDKSKSDRGSLTLRCVRNGERLSGKIALYHTISDRVESGNILWFREKEDLESTVERIKKNKEKIRKLKKEKERIAKEEEEIEEKDDKENGDVIESEVVEKDEK